MYTFCVTREQQLSNYIKDKKFLKAIGLAITLEQPYRVLTILNGNSLFTCCCLSWGLICHFPQSHHPGLALLSPHHPQRCYSVTAGFHQWKELKTFHVGLRNYANIDIHIVGFMFHGQWQIHVLGIDLLQLPFTDCILTLRMLCGWKLKDWFCLEYLFLA